MATNLPSCFSIQFLETFLKFLVNFTLLKYVMSQRNYGFLITKELIFGFQILDLKDHFSASLKVDFSFSYLGHKCNCWLKIANYWDKRNDGVLCTEKEIKSGLKLVRMVATYTCKLVLRKITEHWYIYFILL